MTEDELEKLNEADFVENAQADLDDLMSGRIKSPEHLEAASKLIDYIGEIGDTADHVSSWNTESLYKFVNSKSIEELNSLFSDLLEMNKRLMLFFNVEDDV